jgi:pimeloyl-ACP methyl ester carboxylesterase
MINFYKWKMTRWLVPKVWISASKEKISHAADLRKFEEKWSEHPSKIKVIHGDNDWIVPFENATYLKQVFPEKQIEIISLPGAGHGLIWSQSKQIKEEIVSALHWFD